MTVSLKEVQRVVNDRPFKLNAEDVGYEPAPEGSALRCASCAHLFRRATDGFSVCELFRDEQVDREGVRPDFRCLYWTADSDVYPLAPESKVEEPQPQEDEEDIPY